MIEFKTNKAWRPNIKTDEYHEFNVSGIKLLERDIQQIYSVEVWNGGEWDLRVEGRTSDYMFIPDTGVLYWTRFFLLPARLQSYNAPVWRWGWGEFEFPVRVSYLYGRNPFTDAKQGQMAWDIARKMAAIDIYQSHDYSMLTSSGSDKISLDRKVENWKMEIEDKLESLRGWVFF